MLSILKIVGIISTLTLLGGIDALAEDYRWKEFSFRYGTDLSLAGDSLAEDLAAGEARNISFTAVGGGLRLLLTLIGSEFTADERYQKLPAAASESFCLGLALKLAGEGREAVVSESYGVITVGGSAVPSARLHIPAADGKAFIALECVFHVVHQRAFGAIISYRGRTGEVNHSAELHSALRAAYDLLRSFKVEQLSAEEPAALEIAK